MGFKEDADFAGYVSMGAAGTAEVGRFLRNEHGHLPVELERYAMSNKVWQTKVKRLRLPDLVCLQCGRRVESRAKSKLDIVLSHSDRAGRRWYEGGMRPDDLYAFGRVNRTGNALIVSRPVMFTAGALDAAVDRARIRARKAASEGSEETIGWDCWVPGQSGVLEGVDNQDRIVCRWDNGKTYRYWQWRDWGEPRHLYLHPGDSINAGETIVAGIVDASESLGCPGKIWDIAAALEDQNTTERYAAIKAAGVESRWDLKEQLESIASNEQDWRIRLEAQAALSRLDAAGWTSQIVSVANNVDALDEVRMEAVFALSEIPTNTAAMALAAIADEGDNPRDLRAAAAWGLGRGANPRPDLLLPLTAATDPVLSLHAIVGLESLPDSLVPELVDWLTSGDDRRAASAAHLLARHGKVIELVDVAQRDGRGRLWALSILGDLSPNDVQAAAGGRLNESMIRTLQPLWQAQRDWLRREESRDGLGALDVQTVRFDPVTLS